MMQPTEAPAKRAAAPSKGNISGLKRILGEESGQVLPWVVVVMLTVLGISALSVDLGRAMVIRRQLQVQADAAALAAAETIGSDSSYSTVGQNYSGASGEKNTDTGIAVGTPTITPLCLATVTAWGIPCTSTNPNAISVTETASVPTLFAQLLGKPSVAISATSTASKGRPQPYNIALILDTTPSMADSDPSCTVTTTTNSRGKTTTTTTTLTQLQCAVQGIQALLKGLTPSMDNVSLFTFPNVDTNNVSTEYSCAGTNDLSVPPYTFPIAGTSTLTNMNYSYTTGSGYNQKTVSGYATYQVVGFSSDYRTSDAATTLNSSSNLVKAVGGQSGCSSMGTGYENTYYAGAVYAAQSALVAEKEANPKTENVMILLSDGNATAKQSSSTANFSPGTNDMAIQGESSNYATGSGNYGSWVGECSQGVDAAQAASTAGTLVYTIAYGSPSSSSTANCASDRKSGAAYPDITPCQALQNMSTNYINGDTTHFYSDYNLSGDTGCSASGANSGTTAIADIYALIAAELSGARLIPNGTP